MDNNKKDYWLGLTYFFVSALCICSYFKTPDNDTLLYKFLGIFGIPPGIPIGQGGMLYIYGLFVLIIMIICIKKAIKYWWSYGERFARYNIILRYLPVIVSIIVVLICFNINTIYYSAKSISGGLRAIVFYDNSSQNHINYRLYNDIITYEYYFAFENFSNEDQEFKVKIDNSRWNYDDVIPSEIVIKDDNGEDEVFSLAPKQRRVFSGSFNEKSPTYNNEGEQFSGFLDAKVILYNEHEQCTPKPIVNYLPY